MIILGLWCLCGAIAGVWQCWCLAHYIPNVFWKKWYYWVWQALWQIPFGPVSLALTVFYLWYCRPEAPCRR